MIKVYGDIMLDRWIYGSAKRISPEAPVPILKEKGQTKVSIELKNDKDLLLFELENPRKVDRKTVNLLKNSDILTIIA